MSDADSSSSDARQHRWLPRSSSVSEGLKRLVPRLKARGRLLRRRLRAMDRDGLADGLEKIDVGYVEDGARRVTEDDIESVVENADVIEERFRDNGPLRRLLTDGRLLLALVEDVSRGRYPHVPKWTLGAAAFALLYVLNPFDLVPDALPVLGMLDDAAVVSACVALLEQDLYDYRDWRRAQTENPTSRSDRSTNEGADDAGE